MLSDLNPRILAFSLQVVNLYLAQICCAHVEFTSSYPFSETAFPVMPTVVVLDYLRLNYIEYMH